MNENIINSIARYFEQLLPSDLARLGEIYDDDAVFKDPFNEVRGLAAIERVYRHMFDSMSDPRFTITGRLHGDVGYILMWDFQFGLHGSPETRRCIRGASHLRLADDGRIAAHRDYWDAAELYEAIPLLSVFMRWLRTRAGGS